MSIGGKPESLVDFSVFFSSVNIELNLFDGKVRFNINLNSDMANTERVFW